MEKSTKILIIVVVILVALLGLTVGILLGNYLSQPVVNNTTNSTNNSSENNQNNSNNQVQDQSSNNNFISESQAISIAKKEWPVYDATYYISSYPTSDSPYYWVSVVNNHYYGPGGFVQIDAYTGVVIVKGT